MNLYILVEGKRTEVKVYPAWLATLLPQVTRVKYVHQVVENHYYLFSGDGYPAMLNVLAKTVEDVNQLAIFDYLLLCLDADEVSVAERQQEVFDFIDKNKIVLNSQTKLVLIVQNKCIETWFLGNSKIFKRNPQNLELRNYTNFYNVAKQDPEQMLRYGNFRTNAQFHEAYLKALFVERKISYTKEKPTVVMESTYLQQLQSRIFKTKHLTSFKIFVDFCDEVRQRII
jgi:hypothetical protein